MKIILSIALPVVALFAWSLTRLSSDAIGMALGLAFGVIAGLPAAALVMVAASRRAPVADYDDDRYIDAPVTYSDEVTPYYALARRVMGAPPLPDRQAQLPDRQAQIDQLRAALDYIEANEVQAWNRS